MEKTVKTITLILVPVSLVLLFVADPAQWGLSQDAPWWHRITYMLCHGNILHWGLNMWALLSVVFLFPISMRCCILAFLSAALIPQELVPSAPLVGLSGYIFFLFGSIVAGISNKRYFVTVNFAVILFGALLSNIAWGVHIWCFTLGILYSYYDSQQDRNKKAA